MRMLIAVLMLSLLAPQTISESTSSSATSSKWLLTYKTETGYEMERDQRFRSLLNDGLPHYLVPWDTRYRTHLPLPHGAMMAISNAESVTVESNRFVVLTGWFPGNTMTKGLLWIDTGAARTKVIFVLMDVGFGDLLDASLNIYTNTPDPNSPLPPSLLKSLISWQGEAKVSIITSITVHDSQDRTAVLSNVSKN